MFDLEKSISSWRQQMLAVGIQSPVPLEELEIHLRENIEQLTKSGLSEAGAFEHAVQQIGPGERLKAEFGKAGGIFEKGGMKNLKPVIYIAAAHCALWWILWGILHLPHFGMNEWLNGHFSGGKLEHPILHSISRCSMWFFYILNLPMAGFWNWLVGPGWFQWLGWLFLVPLNSLVWGGFFGGFLNWLGDTVSTKMGKRKIGISLFIITLATTLGLPLVGAPLVVNVTRMSVQGTHTTVDNSSQLPWYSFLIAGLFVAGIVLAILPKQEKPISARN
jgi:hypothetical protein